MYVRNPTAARLTRRFGLWLLMWAVLLGMGIEWMLGELNGWIKALLYFFGLKRLDQWLRSLSFRGVMNTFWIIVAVEVALGLVKLVLLYEEQFWFVAKMEIYQHFTVGIAVNYLLSVFRDQLLTVRWIATLYGCYTSLKSMAIDWVRESEAYRMAVAMKRQFTETRDATLWLHAHRAAPMHRCCIAFA